MLLHHYKSNSGKDLILEYVKSLPDDEKTDAFSVLQCLQNDEMDKIKFKRWEKKDKKIVIKRAKEIGKLLGKNFI